MLPRLAGHSMWSQGDLAARALGSCALELLHLQKARRNVRGAEQWPEVCVVSHVGGEAACRRRHPREQAGDAGGQAPPHSTPW